jgi:DNA-binding response OmpR family regulator
MPAPKVLVVDDSQTIRLQLQKIFTKAGFDVVLAENGKAAFEKISCLPDLIVLDVVMPELDGYSVCEKLRELGEPYSRLPIIFLTSVQSHAMALLGREFGAYLRKPVCPDELLSIARQQLKLSQPHIFSSPAAT